MIVQGRFGDVIFKTYSARLLAGRLFDPARFTLDIGNGDKGPAARLANVIPNRTAVRRLGFARATDAIDQVVARDAGAVRIVGVVDDMRFGTSRDPVDLPITRWSNGSPGSTNGSRCRPGFSSAPSPSPQASRWRRSWARRSASRRTNTPGPCDINESLALLNPIATCRSPQR